MSHISRAKTKITNPDSALLRQAVELVAAQRECLVTDYYLDWGRKKQKAGLALLSGKLQRGMAISVNEAGELEFIGDFYGVDAIATELQQLITQTYTSLAVMQALRAEGYLPEAQEGADGQILITGVSCYA